MGAVRPHVGRCRTAGRSDALLIGALILIAASFGVAVVPRAAASTAGTELWQFPAGRGEAEGVAGREVFESPITEDNLRYAVDIFNPDGSVETSRETEGGGPLPALAADGSGCVVLGETDPETVEAISRAGATRWTYQLSSPSRVKGLTVGKEGFCYVALETGHGEEVLRLSSLTGKVREATPLPESDGSPDYDDRGRWALIPTAEGVAAVTSGAQDNQHHVVFVSRAGKITADVKVDSLNSVTLATGNNEGAVFVASAEPWSQPNGLTIVKLSSKGKKEWKKKTGNPPRILAEPRLAALPDGGVAYGVEGQVGVFNANGTTRWTVHPFEGYRDLATDAADHVDLIPGCVEAEVDCRGFAVEQLSGETGEPGTTAFIGVYEGSSTVENQGFAIGPELFYVHCSADKPEDPCAKTQIAAFALPGTTGAYPTPPPTAEVPEAPTIEAPEWWSGECDSGNYAKAVPLGPAWHGLVACGPRPIAEGGPDRAVMFFPGAHGEYEWECVELSMRWLYLAYGVRPYRANGNEIVDNYSPSDGGGLVVERNGTPGVVPEEGDVLEFRANRANHTAVVTASTVGSEGRGEIEVIQQNETPTGRGTYNVKNWVVAGGVTDWLHKP